jgi:succinyl-diaminopimelate desuccinylase
MTDLVELTAQLVDIPSVSKDEGALAHRVAEDLGRCPHLDTERIGDAVVARTALGRARRLVLAGHLDTVPGFGADGPRVRDDTVWGLGAVDMKGGLAVLLALAAGATDPACDLTFVFYPCEEIEHRYNGLAALIRTRPELLAGDAAVLSEPTGGVVEAGCQGTLRAAATVVGRRAHTARPFQGVNAIHRLAPILHVVAGYRPRVVELDGCAYVEQVQAVRIDGGVAGNVVPDRAELLVNHRFAPDRDEAGAAAALRDLLGATLDEAVGDTFGVTESAPSAPPALDHPLLRGLVEATDAPPRAKLGWTDVATFWAAGVPAANFGPGDPELCHTPDEHVSRAELERAHAVLSTALATG